MCLYQQAVNVNFLVIGTMYSRQEAYYFIDVCTHKAVIPNVLLEDHPTSSCLMEGGGSFESRTE